MPTLYSPSKKYFNRNDSSFHGGPRRASFSSSKKKLSLLGPFGSLSLSLSPLPNHSQDTLSLSFSPSHGSFVPPSLPFRFQFLPDFAEFRPKGFRFYLPRPPRVLASFCSPEFYARGYTLDFAEFRRPPSFFRIISSSRPHRTRSLSSLSLPLDSLSLIFNGLAHRPPFCFLASIAIELLQEIDPTSSSSLSLS